MKKIALTLVFLLARVALAAEPTVLARLRAKIEVEPVSAPTLAQFAGKYSNPTKEFSPALSGDDLFLFPDGTYLYDEWADIHPLTIHDKGHWRIEDGVVVLSSDKEITWDPGAERRYIAINRQDHPSEVLLIGLNRALITFEEARDVQPETELMIVAEERSALIKSQGAAAKIRKKLMQTAWDPDYFRDPKK